MKGDYIMKFDSKTTDIFRIAEVKKGTDTRGKDWYFVKAESAEGKINLFCNAFNFPRFAENVGKRCKLVLEYEENFNSRKGKKFTSFTLKDIEILD